jgi:hypothetical protein
VRCFFHTAAAVLASLLFGDGASSAVYSFESGFEEWESYEVYRDETDVLGGAYAMYGYDGSRMWMVFELTGAEELVMDTYFTGDNPELNPRFVAVLARRRDSQGDPVGDLVVVGYGESLIATSHNPMPNPDRRRYDLTDLVGTYEVRITWPQLACTPEDPAACFEIHFPGYVDTVAVPEASPFLLGSTAALAIASFARSRSKRLRRAEGPSFKSKTFAQTSAVED